MVRYTTAPGLPVARWAQTAGDNEKRWQNAAFEFKRSHKALVLRAAFASVSASAPPSGDLQASCPGLRLLPVAAVAGSKKQRYVWDGSKIQRVNEELLNKGYTPAGRLEDGMGQLLTSLYNAYLPDARDVTPDYFDWLKWRLSHRFFSSVMQNFATQSLLMAVGVGAKKALAASAAINWMLKDGLGRIVRMTVATNFGQQFDADLKRFRFTTATIFTACVACEFLTPVFPRHFLLLASISNVGRAVGLTTFISTQPAFAQALSRGGNMADLSAKTQAQHMVVDTLALTLSAALTYALRNSDRGRFLLPLLLYPICAIGDLYCIRRELRSLQLNTLNRERAEMVAEQWVQSRRIPDQAEVASLERLLGPPDISRGFLPLHILPLEQLVTDPEALGRLLHKHSLSQYMLDYIPAERDKGLPWIHQPKATLGVTLSQTAKSADIIAAVLEAAYARSLLTKAVEERRISHSAGSSSSQSAEAELPEAVVADVLLDAQQRTTTTTAAFLKDLEAGGWQTQPFLLSTSERNGYVRLDNG